MTERIGQRARVRDYFSVQVKSTEEPWKFNDVDSIKWLVEHPSPLFLCTVDKKTARLRVYHVFPRFEVWALGKLPKHLELVPGKAPSDDDWLNGSRFPLSDPIIEAGLEDLIDDRRMEKLREVFAHWVRLDRENCDLVRQGLFRFRRPGAYRVNELPIANTQLDRMQPDLAFLKRGLFRLAEAVECIGGQLGNSGDYAFALKAALLLDHIQTKYEDVFAGNNFWSVRVPGWLGIVVNDRLNRALGEAGYHYAGLDAVEETLASDTLVKKYCEA